MTVSFFDLDEMASTLEQLTDHFYERARSDQVFREMFSGMAGEGRQAVADFVGEVFSGSIAAPRPEDGHAHGIARHVGRFFTLGQRRLWMDMLLDSSNAVGLTDDRELRLAVVEYLEWGARMAVQRVYRSPTLC